jgi:hypothetical protein
MNAGTETPTNPFLPTHSLSIDPEIDADGGDVRNSNNRISDVSGYMKSKHILPYNCPLPSSLFMMSTNHPHSKICPFHQQIQLSGPSQYAVRTTTQIDNGAMRNYIGKHIWDSYGHCFGSLSPTDAYISVTNNEHIPCTGLWSGDISLAGMKFHTHFFVFDCRGAFDVILGKPWLHKARTIHYYANDILSISTDTNTTVIGNTQAGDDVNTHTNLPAIPKPTSPATNTKSLDDHIHAEVYHIEILQHKNGPIAES